MEDNKPLAMAPAQIALSNFSDLVKSNLITVVVAAVVVVVLAAFYFTTNALQSPQALLNREIDLEIEKAKRMLYNYEPGGQHLMNVIDAATSQPESGFVSEDQWPPSMRSLQDRLGAAEMEVQPLRSEFNRLSGGRESMEAPAGSYAELRGQLEANLKQVDEALQVVRSAINLSRESGDETFTGRSHPVATRLHAVLAYHKADLLRRQAAIQRDEAVAARQKFDNLRGQWQLLQAQITAIETVGKGGVIGEATQPAPVAGAAAAAKDVAKAPEQPAKKDSGRSRRGGFARMLTGLVSGRDAEVPQATEPSPAPEPADSTESAVANETAESPSRALSEKLATPKQRLDDLNAEKTRAKAAIAAAEMDVDRLGKQKDILEAALATANQAARNAQLLMMKLEEEGVDPVDPGGMDRFTADYRKASEEYRKEIREAAILEKGGIRNARPGTQDEQELLTAPLVQVDPSQPMQSSEGLISVTMQLDAARAQLKASKGWLGSVDAQIETVNRAQQDETARLAALRASQVSLRDEAAKALQVAAAATAKADESAQQAIGLLEGEGKQAAQNARNAVSRHISQARDRQVPGAENARLDMITKTGFLVGYAETLEADLDLVKAYLLAERAADLRRQSLILKQAEGMGIPADQQSEPAYAYRQAAAAEEAGKSAKDAVAAAKEALEVYAKADAPLKSLWVLRANMGAVYHLLAILQTGKDRADSLQLAKQTYEQALQDRRDRKDAEPYMVSLKAIDDLIKAGQ